MPVVSEEALWGLFKHAFSWLTNLSRAGEKRKSESIRALRAVIQASRQTAIYVSHLEGGGARDRQDEMRISLDWTSLGFRLKDLSLTSLSKRCDIKGKYWSDRTHYDKDFLSKADVALGQMELLAREMLHQMEH